MATSELACVYAALILHDDGLDITVMLLALITQEGISQVERVKLTIVAKIWTYPYMHPLVCCF